MKQILVLASALFALSAAPAFAVNTTGVWTGAGKLSDNKGNNITCESMIVTIAHTATSLKVDSVFTCGGDKQQAPGGLLDIKNGNELWANGARVGTISATSVVMSSDNGQRKLDTKTTFSEKEMTFNTVTTFRSGEVLTFVGTVRR